MSGAAKGAFPGGAGGGGGAPPGAGGAKKQHRFSVQPVKRPRAEGGGGGEKGASVF